MIKDHIARRKLMKDRSKTCIAQQDTSSMDYNVVLDVRMDSQMMTIASSPTNWYAMGNAIPQHKINVSMQISELSALIGLRDMKLAKFAVNTTMTSVKMLLNGPSLSGQKM